MQISYLLALSWFLFLGFFAWLFIILWGDGKYTTHKPSLKNPTLIMYLKFSRMNDFEAGQAHTVVLNKYSVGLQQEQKFRNESSMENKVLKTNEVEYNPLTWSDWAKSLPHAGSLYVLEMI